MGWLTEGAPKPHSPIERKAIMTEKNSGPEEGIKGIVEDVKGKAKETVGTVTGRDDMVREGKAQQDKADAQQDAAKKEAEAESARAGAAAAEKRQEANQ
ncbi:CsbD family protein [Mycolicibacterium vanbaalenii PYR-1]|uniref:CsbD family protein n=2 Tax=Mycolicibacterium TaxID=1866885 RepID=A1T5N6_MYCVP|nr:CsbD family protein [Mycolicibacterium vanbaalenii PYR-1]